jgi:hypothetical protein
MLLLCVCGDLEQQVQQLKSFRDRGILSHHPLFHGYHSSPRPTQPAHHVYQRV